MEPLCILIFHGTADNNIIGGNAHHPRMSWWGAKRKINDGLFLKGLKHSLSFNKVWEDHLPRLVKGAIEIVNVSGSEVEKQKQSA
jgi:hypothetical protein